MRILIADDHTLFRRGLKLLLQRLYPKATLHEAGDAEEARRTIDTTGAFDFVLLDLEMPGMNGYAGVRRFVEAQEDHPVIMLSAHVEPEQVLKCVDAGVRGYIPKSVTEDVLRHALALIEAGEVFLPTSLTQRMTRNSGREMPNELQHLPGDNPLRLLTRRQCDTLRLLIEGQSNKEIARNLGLLESTVKAHIKVILKKLNAQNRTQAALVATDLGWPRATRTHR